VTTALMLDIIDLARLQRHSQRLLQAISQSERTAYCYPNSQLRLIHLTTSQHRPLFIQRHLRSLHQVRHPRTQERSLPLLDSASCRRFVCPLLETAPLVPYPAFPSMEAHQQQGSAEKLGTLMTAMINFSTHPNLEQARIGARR